jgi:polyhydroxyalkanoate synthesis repressor PhaR
MAKSPVVIKKYSDRRLYDTNASGYVKLDDIARMVRKGVDVQVKDARSGKDLTSMVLTQIIVEDARERETALPLQLLRELVRASDRATHDFMSWYLTTTLDLYQKAQETARSRFPEATAALSKPVEFVRSLLAGHEWPPASGAGEVEILRRRVEELEAQLAQRDTPKHPGMKRKRRA